MIARKVFVGTIGAIALVATLLVPTGAHAAPIGTVMVTTQRMSDATLNSTQSGWYQKGAKLSLVCFKRGQSVKGYFSPWIPGGWDNLWYKVSDGYFVADVDIDTGSNNPVTPECGTAMTPGTGPAAPIDPNQWYSVVNRNSGLAIDVRGGNTTNGTALQQYAWNNSGAQKFRFISTGGGYYRILSQRSGSQVWDVAGGGTGNGAKIHTWNYGGGANQQWRVVVSGSYVVFSPRHATTRCIDVPGGSKAQSVQLQIYTCNNSAAQQFTLKKLGYVTPPPPPPPGRYIVPFTVGETWYVCQGYNGTPSHGSDPALDITAESARGTNGCWGNANASAARAVYAPVSGNLAQVSASFGGICITPTSGGGSIYLGHLVDRRANGWVNAGDRIGTVASAGQVSNGGYAHVHLSARAGTGCGGTHVPFDAAHSARIIGAPDMTNSGAANQWAGTILKR